MVKQDVGQLSGGSATPGSLADLAAAMRADTTMWKGRREEIARYLAGIAQLVNQRPRDTPASPRLLYQMIIVCGVLQSARKRALWEKLRPHLRAAVERWGLSEAPGRYKSHLNNNWQRFSASLPNRQARLTLSRFMYFMQLRGLSPSDVDDSHIAAFHEIIAAEGLVHAPQRVIRAVCLCWNVCRPGPAIAKTNPVRLCDHTGNYALARDMFPFSFQMEVESYLAFRARDVAASDRTPLRPQSLTAVRQVLFAYASALTRSGLAATAIDSLAAIASPEMVHLALRFLVERSGGPRTKQMTHFTSQIASVGRLWLRLPDAFQVELDRLRSEYGWQHHGIAKKNRVMISQFESENSVRTLLSLPRRLTSLAAERELDKRSAQMVMAALIIEILLNVPLRPVELLNLEIDRDIVSTPNGATAFLVIQHRYLSTRSRLVQISTSCRTLLMRYLSDYRSLLSERPCAALFPSWSGRPLGGEALRRTVRQWSMRLAGVEMTLTGYRHFAAKHYLDEHPGDFPVIRVVLGHKLLATTNKTYSQMGTSRATRHIDEEMFGRRSKKSGVVADNRKLASLTSRLGGRYRPRQRLSSS